MRTITRPLPDEYAPDAKRYIALLPGDEKILDHLQENLESTTRLIRSLPDAKLLQRYAADKWTIKEIVVHIVDDERIYAYRALRFARADRTELPGFEQNDYATESGANDRDIEDILDEFATVRAATISLFEGLPEVAFKRSGIANGVRMSVRGAAYHIAGHELWHVGIIREKCLSFRA